MQDPVENKDGDGCTDKKKKKRKPDISISVIALSPLPPQLTPPVLYYYSQLPLGINKTGETNSFSTACMLILLDMHQEGKRS